MSFCSRLALIVGLATLCDATLKPLEASSIIYSTLASDGTYINTGYVVGVSGSLGIDHDVAAPFTPSMDAILASFDVALGEIRSHQCRGPVPNVRRWRHSRYGDREFCNLWISTVWYNGYRARACELRAATTVARWHDILVGRFGSRRSFGMELEFPVGHHRAYASR